MQIIDDFLSPSDFELVHNYLTGDNFTWNYNNGIANKKRGLDQFQFVHTFFDISKPSLNNWSNFLQPVLTRLNAQFIFRIKANLRPRTAQGVLSPFHTDMNLNQQTAILYLNTNNGYTKFKDDALDDVPSVANRLVTFYGHLEHCGVSATDCNNRIVLNINYIPTTLKI